MNRLIILSILSLLICGPSNGQANSNQESTILFAKNQAGYKFYRIPSLYTTVKGTVIALCEGRRSRSDQAHNDIVMRRSLDHGKTWGAQQTIVDYGYSSVNNPLLVQDRRDGKIFLFYQVYSINVREKTTGDLFGNLDCRAYYISSMDDGETWSTPKDITSVARPDDASYTLASGPGIGIQMKHGDHKGRLVVPFNQGPWGKWKVFCLYSDDGINWLKSTLVPDNAHGMGNEAQVVELSDGMLLMNVRSAGGQKMRKSSFSKDGGRHWSTFREEHELIEPGCMASIIRYSDQEGEYLLFSNPADDKKRRNGTVFISLDDGISWTVCRQVVRSFYAYSCLTQLPDNQIGLLFEKKRYKRIEFTKFGKDCME